jgi:3-isopropylmalate dehydrogenase
MAKDRYHIVTLPGDGIGPEVTAQAVGVLQVAAEKYGVVFDLEEIPGGGEYYMEHGVEWPKGSEARVDAADAILLGAVGANDADGKSVFTKPGQPYPTPQLAGYAQVIGNRLRLQLYANQRPVKLYPGVRHKVSGEFMQVWKPEHVDYVVVRENTEEAYSGKAEDLTSDAGDVIGRATPMEITRAATERVVRYAFRLAQRRKASGYPGKVTCVTKSNIIGAHKYFEQLFQEFSADYPEIEADTALFDAFCMWQIRNPEWFDVVVAPNLVGDVISDNGSTTQGGMGLAAGGNIGDEHGMFEPIHGSAPKHAGQDKVNPIAAVLAGAMLCDWLGARHDDARLVSMGLDMEAAVGVVLEKGDKLTYDLGGSAKCSELGEALREAVAASPKR